MRPALLAASASSVNLKFLEVDQCHEPPNSSCDAAWDHKTSVWLVDIGALGGIMVVSVGAAGYALRRRDPHTRPKAKVA